MLETRTANLKILASKPLISVDQIREAVPLSEAAVETTLNARQELIDILEGRDKRLAIIIGPCSIHDRDLAMDYAKRLKPLHDKYKDKLLILMRVYFEKPRTTVGWKGLIYDPHLNGSNDITEGLQRSRGILVDIADMGLPTATELLDPVIAAYISHLVSWVAIGARTTESQTHRQMTSGLSTPVGFKNGTDGSMKIAINAIQAASYPQSFVGVNDGGQVSIIDTKGNPHAHIVLRGGIKGPNYDEHHIAHAEKMLEEAKVLPKIMVDCSHDNSGKDHSKQHLVLEEVLRQKKAGNQSIFSLMIESNIEEGNQKVGDDKSQLKYGVSITDKCIGWTETEDLLEKLYTEL